MPKAYYGGKDASTKMAHRESCEKLTIPCAPFTYWIG